MNAYRFGVAIATKSTVILRDTNILADIQAHSPVLVKVTITTADDNLCGIIEPGAPLSSERFEAVRKLSDSGIYVGILMMPVLPFIEDTEANIREIVHRAKESGAHFIYPAIGMTLRAGNREYYYEKLDQYFPGVKERYIKKYDERYNCPSPNAKKLWSAFAEECSRHELRHQMKDIITDYKRGYTARQLNLFE